MSEYIDWSVKTKGIVGARSSKTKRLESDHEITLDMVEDGYRKAAKIVQDHGEAYLPIFERLCLEREQRMKTQSLLEKVWEINS